ncbi:MAG: acylneuraminate cytidylyltransferase family protein [Candidatus Omnitrophica bacterium]|nr:acylneuraminate cytidylyltransferase family protein [Candidatus Omnitrophota bacterium]
MSQPNILVTIAARRGSKGVVGKNIRPLNGKPLMLYSVNQARQWGKASRIVVSTDDPLIAQVAKEAGAEVPFTRPDALSTDDCPKGKVIRHALIECEKKYQEVFDMVVDLDATAPIRTIQDLDMALEKFEHSDALTLFSVVKAHKNPYFNMVEDHQGYARICKSLKGEVYRRQDTPKVMDMNASIYFYRRQYLLDHETPVPITEKSLYHEMDELSAYDIDREIDFKFLEFLMNEKLIHL